MCLRPLCRDTAIAARKHCLLQSAETAQNHGVQRTFCTPVYAAKLSTVIQTPSCKYDPKIMPAENAPSSSDCGGSLLAAALAGAAAGGADSAAGLASSLAGLAGGSARATTALPRAAGVCRPRGSAIRLLWETRAPQGICTRLSTSSRVPPFERKDVNNQTWRCELSAWLLDSRKGVTGFFAVHTRVG